MAKADKKSTGCARCACSLGDETKTLPHTVDGESYCPQCFVWNIVPTDSVRFSPNSFYAVCCTRCYVTSVSVGSTSCGQCGHRMAVTLGPKKLA